MEINQKKVEAHRTMNAEPIPYILIDRCLSNSPDTNNNSHAAGDEKTRKHSTSSLGYMPQQSSLIPFLDKVIVLLMTAIMLAIVWPVGMVLWGQSHPAQKIVCLSSDPPTVHVLRQYTKQSKT